MLKPRCVLAFLAALAVAGCSTVERARESQREAEGRGKGDMVLSGACPAFDGSLEEMVSYALTNRPSMASARLAVEDARLALKAIAADAPLASSTPWTAVDVNANGGYSASSAPAHLDKLKGKTSGSGCRTGSSLWLPTSSGSAPSKRTILTRFSIHACRTC